MRTALANLQKINVKVIELAQSAKYYTGRFIPKISENFSSKVMIIGEMPTVPKQESEWDPSDNFFLSKTDLKFNKLLNKLGLSGSYITDIVKTGDKARRPTVEEIEKFKAILLDEIEIIKPEIILSLSKNASNILNEMRVKNTCIWHPAYVERFNRWAEYENQLKKALGR